MSDIFSLHFDGAVVQAVKLRTAGASVTIRESATFPFDEIDDYLSTCKVKSCIVSCNPQAFYQDIVHLPPAAGKLYDKLVRNEIQNLHPDLTSVSIFHRTIGEATIDSRLFNKIVVFSYPIDFLSDFISAINRHGITISRVFAAPCSIFRLGLSICGTDPDQPRIFVASLPGEKLLLVGENHELEFIRKIPALETPMLPEDALNINMTVDYCFQSLRVRPFEVVMLNLPELSADLAPLVAIPYRSSLPPQLADLAPHIIQDYLAPIAAALHSLESPAIGNIMPADYASFTTNRKILTAAALSMVVLSLILAAFLVNESITISGLKSKIGRMRTELSGSAGEIAAFRKLDAEVKLLKQPLDFINKHNLSLNPAAALAALNLPASASYMLKGITVQSGEAFLNVQIEGVINASGYSDTQAVFEEVAALIARIPGYAVSSSRVEIKQKTFSIQARYNGGGKQPR